MEITWPARCLDGNDLKSGEVPDVGGIDSLVEDLTPQLGGDLDLNTHKISDNEFIFGDGLAGNKIITAKNADVNPPKLRYNDTTNKWQYTNDGTSWLDIGTSAGIANVVEDLTPQLGGDLDMLGHKIGGNSEAELDDAVAKKHAQNTDTGTSDNDFSLGDGLAGNKSITANNADVNKPKLRYNDSTNKWQFSNNGTDWSDIGTSAGISNVVEDTSPQLGGDLETLEHEILLNSSPGSNLTASGFKAVFMNGNAGSVAFGDVCYVAADGHLEFADADAAATMPALYMALGTIAAAASGQWLKLGFARNDSWSWTKGPGEAGLVYVSLTGTTGNTLTQTKPSVAGDQAQIIGHAIASNIIDFNPCPVLVEIA